MTITAEPAQRRLRRVVSPELIARMEADEATVSTDGDAACASARALGIPASAWTPESEAEVVPPMLMRICERCPIWGACLREAVRMNDVGYRASTTTSQRRLLFPEMAPTGRASVQEPRRSPASEIEHRPRHPRGEGSLSLYRRGCRCDECRGHNAAARRRERARAS
ncbi:MAG: hypothetical protein Q4G43_10225 [Mobilicoccus sp.]|nr:hypothetical protein [Mobilicoccus sp.]